MDAGRLTCQVVARLDLPREEAAPKWRVGDDADAQLPACRDHTVLFWRDGTETFRAAASLFDS